MDKEEYSSIEEMVKKCSPEARAEMKKHFPIFKQIEEIKKRNCPEQEGHEVICDGNCNNCAIEV